MNHWDVAKVALPLTNQDVLDLKEALDAAKLTRASFSNLFPDDPLPTSEKEVTEFIRRRTRLYRETWVIPTMRRLLAKIDPRTLIGEEVSVRGVGRVVVSDVIESTEGWQLIYIVQTDNAVKHTSRVPLQQWLSGAYA
jgi:hypothetical protein